VNIRNNPSTVGCVSAAQKGKFGEAQSAQRGCMFYDPIISMISNPKQAYLMIQG